MGHLGGLDKVFKIRDRHHRIRRKILRKKGPIRSSDQIFTYFNASAVSRSTKPEIFMSLSLSVLSQSGPPKSVGGGGGVGGRRGGGVVYHTSTGQYIGVATFFFFFFLFEPGVKLDEKSIENGLEGQKFLVVCLFWGGCHHPNRS